MRNFSLRRTGSEPRRTGERTDCPWGYYDVLDSGIVQSEEFCEKTICIFPGYATSLHRHAKRREIWQVESGVLTAIINGTRQDVHRNETLIIPIGAVHCMANLSRLPVVVNEKQLGLCREDDLERLADSNGRSCTSPNQPSDQINLSLTLYREILENLQS
ncbi:MAG: phosphomannose isomerase type II C-terminal cupin domain [Alphaproteobacteria bacterium]